MKQIIFTLVIILLSGCAKQVDVPAVVMEAFSKQFPGAKNIEWSKESENEFEAVSLDGNVLEAKADNN